MTGVKWVDLVCAWGTNRACVLGYVAGIHWFTNRRFVRQYDLAMVQHCSMNQKMKDDEMVLIAQPLLESRTCAYLEWLANEVIMTANKT